MAFIKGWKLTLVLLVAIPFMIVLGAALSVLISKATSKGQEAYAQAGAVVEQAISAIRTVRIASFTFFAQPTFSCNHNIRVSQSLGIKYLTLLSTYLLNVVTIIEQDISISHNLFLGSS